jgi:hypothetical protein
MCGSSSAAGAVRRHLAQRLARAQRLRAAAPEAPGTAPCPSVFHASISSLTCFTTFAGLPTTTERGGICISDGTKQSAPTMLPAPTVGVVHHDGVHADQRVLTDPRAVHDGAVADVRACARGAR